MNQEVLFPHENYRLIQKELVEDISNILLNKNHAVIHAPTGLGKTASVLSPALTIALNKKLKIFFLTSRHTQHKIVLETAEKIKQKYKTNFFVASFIGKKHMCLQENVESMLSSNFNEYCKALKEEKACGFYLNSKNKARQKFVLDELKNNSPISTERVKVICSGNSLCPYELSIDLAEQSTIIVADYQYLFNPFIRENFLKKVNAELSESIIIVDEAHNLPNRAREILSSNLSFKLLKRAINETKKFGLEDLSLILVKIIDLLSSIFNGLNFGQEKIVSKEFFLNKMGEIKPVDVLIPELKVAADIVLAKQKRSSLNSIAEFLELWPKGDKEFVRYVKKEKDNPQLILSCLDPSLLTKNVILNSYSTILMSGTLLPTIMYQDVLGFPQKTFKKEYPSPFPEKNKLTLIIPSTTTKFSQRTKEQFINISLIVSNITNNVAGNSIIFFPSYELRNNVFESFVAKSNKSVLFEQSGMSKDEKQGLLEKFSSYKDQGAVMLCVASGSFGEGIDLPGIVKCIIVVGLPLERPDIESNAKIQYYDALFGKGWDYGYTLPAITKTLQNAGRCIRSETDKGVLVFLDERYSWPRYKNCFPKEWNLIIAENYLPLIKEFFDNLYIK